jgi:Cu+-exporting ATPase
VTAVRTADPKAAAPTVVSIAIDGMTCGACAARIERRLNTLDGVEATVNYASERARVTVSGELAPGRLIDAIESAGYSAELVDAAAPNATGSERIDARVRSLGRRLVVAAILFMPLCDASIAFWLVPWLRFPGWQWVLIAMAAPVLTWAAWPFYEAALRAARHGTTTMDTLASVGILAATGWSLYAMFFHDIGHRQLSLLFEIEHQSSGAIYLDVAAGVTTFLLAGRYFEALFRRRSGDALRSLAAVGAKDVAVVDTDGVERRLPVAHLSVGDSFVVRPGETVATDGAVVSGRCSIDRSAMTGEFLAAEVGPADPVVGGTVCVGGRIVVRATRVGRDTQLAQMIRLVEAAQSEKANVQRLADRISGIFVPTVLVIAAATLLGWLLAGGSSTEAFRAALSVLIIACPCALGLATPAALVVASGRGAQLGIFLKGHQALEASQQVDTVLLDKTGTLTQGEMVVADVLATDALGRAALLRLAGSLEQASEHLVGRAVAAGAARELGALPPVTEFVARPGLGAQGSVDGHAVVVGSAALLARSCGAVPGQLARRGAEWEGRGWSVVFVGRDSVMIGALALSDTLRPTARAAVERLQRLGLRCVLLTGDNEAAGRAVAEAIGVTEVIAAASPEDKVSVIRRLQGEGRSVAMVGDGVNDGPALATADLGLAVGSGTDVAINAADVIIVRDDLRIAATAIDLARRTMRTIRANLRWAFAYNVAAIPLAVSGVLNPLIAGAAMALSSAFVLWNSSRLRHVGTGDPAASDPATAGGPPLAPRSATHPVGDPAEAVLTP